MCLSSHSWAVRRPGFESGSQDAEALVLSVATALLVVLRHNWHLRDEVFKPRAVWLQICDPYTTPACLLHCGIKYERNINSCDLT